ncbi:MAG: S41 family peptidase [Deltaproteobacteria bacterium]|nr:S41 family peptidase [Deltaproteobacteria bacterium]
MKKFAIVIVFLVFFLLASKTTDLVYKKLAVFSQVYSYIKNNYVENVSDEKLVYAAIQGMIDVLDPHSAFLTPEQYSNIKEGTTGEYVGIGIEVAVKEGEVVVVSAFDDSPAFHAGIKSGDIIFQVDDKVLKGRVTVDEVNKMLKGPAGSEVILKIKRKPLMELITIKLIRERIRMQSVTYDLFESGIGYVRISSFQDRTYVQLREAVRSLTEKAGGELKGLILDLRNNPGGLFEQAVRVADFFISDGVIVYTQGRGKKEEYEPEMAHPDDTQPDYPMICLVNSGSASASEIVAGALQDHKRAIIAGSNTFGKGSVQTILELEDKSALKLTVAKYYTPNKKSIQEVGIVPDIEINEIVEKKDESLREKDLPRHLKGKKKSTQESVPQVNKLLEKDSVLLQAYNYLKAIVVVNDKLKKEKTKEQK